MQVIDWKKLKDGDIFKIHGTPSRDTMYQLGLTYPAGTVYVKKKNYWAFWSNPEQVFGNSGPTHTFPQLVEVFEASDERASFIKGFLAKVGSTTGTDPEIFVTDEKDQLIPAFKFLPTQTEALKLHPTTDNYGYKNGTNRSVPYRDGFAAESYVCQNTCHGYLLDDIKGGLNKVLAAATKYNPKAKLSIVNTVTIPDEMMKEAKDDEVALGCSPSFNAYNDNPQLPTNARDFMFRFTGGHVHLALDYLNDAKPYLKQIIQGCDLMAAMPGVAIFRNFDHPIRRQFYGRAGEYRRPSYGVEYRTLSNAWLGHPKITHLFLNLVRIGSKVGRAGLVDSLNLPIERMREIINFCDVDAARQFVLSKSDLYTTALLQDGALSDYPDQNKKAFEQIVSDGVESLFPNFGDFPSAWELAAKWRDHSNENAMFWGKAYLHLKAA